MIEYASVPIGAAGELCCSRCGVPGEVTARDAAEVAADVTGVVARWPGGPGPNVTYTGFEPFAHHQLPALVTSAAQAGVQRLRLRTDAGALASPGNAAGAFAAGVRQLEVVLLGGSAHSHDRLAEKPGLFEAASAGVAAWRSAAAEAGDRTFVSLRAPVCRHNEADLPQIAAVAAAWRCEAVHFVVTGDAAPEALSAALETATVHGVAAFVTGAPVPSQVYAAPLWREVDV